MKKYLPWFGFAVVAVLALSIRFYDLGRSAVRSDEINFLNIAINHQTVSDLWKNPPWMNQIPLADSIAVMWHWVRPGMPSEQTVREPFALIGFLTVIGVTIWLMRRIGTAAGLLFGTWIALLPFHVYLSREAYYYVVVVALSAGLSLLSVDLLVRLRKGQAPSIPQYIIWTVWAVLTCLSHMSTWFFVGLIWVMLMLTGKKVLPRKTKQVHQIRMLLSAVVVGLFMIRWVSRAIQEMQKVSQSDGHLGGAFGWVGPRVLPFFTVGANTAGVCAVILVIIAAIVVFISNRRKKVSAGDLNYSMVSLLTIAGLIAAYAYIGLVGGGAAKISYFTSLLPLFLVWASASLDKAAGLLPGRASMAAKWLLLIALAGILWTPAWMVTKLDGKPVPYKVLRDWLDQNLDPGSVVVVDRWYEPWNEMARYAPTNVTVTFTVPDEPYENYQTLHWRDVTRQAIESGKVQAFIRLTRNHEAKDGLWTWPESFYARRAVVENKAGLWLRTRGFAANEDFYASNTNRLIAEIFYDKKSDVLDRVRREGKQFHIFYGAGLPYEKSGPMQIFRFQTQGFTDWRVLERQGVMEVANLTDSPANVSLKILAISPRGPKLVSAGNGQKTTFSGTRMQAWDLGPLEIPAGGTSIRFDDTMWDRTMNPLLISDVQIVPVSKTAAVSSTPESAP